VAVLVVSAKEVAVTVKFVGLDASVGIDMPLPGPAGVRHRYVLALPPGSQSAELWVDGVKLYSGYTGLNEYLYHRGPEIGVARYRSTRGVGVFWSFRFEIG
jgi:hypothetical protein